MLDSYVEVLSDYGLDQEQETHAIRVEIAAHALHPRGVRTHQLAGQTLSLATADANLVGICLRLAGFAISSLLSVLLAAILLGRSISVQVGSIHAELKPNGGSSLRDAIDRVEAKADAALTQIADMKAQPPSATAIVVTPPSPPATP